MNNDLISREALKEQFTKGAYTSKGVREVIDNAPTVEYPFYAEAYQTGYEEAKKDFERPTGEWVGNAFDEHHCNKCGHYALWEEEPDGYYEVQSRFCPNCGVKMGKDGEEE